jgi:two-component system response regulator DevR
MDNRRTRLVAALAQTILTALLLASVVALLAGGGSAWPAVLVLAVLALLCALGITYLLVGAHDRGIQPPTPCDHPDAVLLDVRRVGNDNLDACRALVARPDTRIIVLASSAEDDLLADALTAGAAGYLLQPLSPGTGVVPIPSRDAKQEDERHDAQLRAAVHQQAEVAFAGLTQQELRVLSLIAEGRTNREIAEALYLGDGTVRNYVSNILSKLNLSNRAEAAAYAVQNHLRDYLSAPSSSRTV